MCCHTDTCLMQPQKVWRQGPGVWGMPMSHLDPTNRPVASQACAPSGPGTHLEGRLRSQLRSQDSCEGVWRGDSGSYRGSKRDMGRLEASYHTCRLTHYLSTAPMIIHTSHTNHTMWAHPLAQL